MKLLIADDEQYVRNAIGLEIDWAKYGIELVGIASNGKEAIDLALAVKPDVLLTDIRMPVVNGLAAMRQIKKHLPRIQVILYTVLNEFNYAREAIRLGAANYLLKPCSEEEIIRALLAAKLSLDASRED